MKLKLAAPALLLASLSTGCKTTTPASQAKVDVPLSPKQVNQKQVRSFISQISLLMSNQQDSIDPQLVLGFFPLTKAELAKINAMQYSPLTGSCTGNVCTLSTTGANDDGVQVTLSQVKLPTVGAPTLWAAKTMTFVIRLADADHIELCKVDGIQVKKFFVWVSFYGALFDLSNDDYLVDLGPEGSYPKDCTAG